MSKEKSKRSWLKEIIVIAVSVITSVVVIFCVFKFVSYFSQYLTSWGGVVSIDDTESDTEEKTYSDIDSDSEDIGTQNGETDLNVTQQTEDHNMVTHKPETDETQAQTDDAPKTGNTVQTDGKLYSRTGEKKAGLYPSHPAPYTVIIDPGHGFADGGCVNELLRGKTEKDITMEMALLLREELEKRGFEVILIHDGKTFPSVKQLIALADQYNVYYEEKHFVDNNIFSAYERSIYANIIAAQQTVDFYISLHVNSVDVEIEKRSGFEIDYCVDNDYSEGSGRIFDCIVDKISSYFPDTKMNIFRDSWDDSFIVTKFPIMPSVLFEMGFATNETDAANFFNPSFCLDLVDALADGISEYFD